MYQTSTPTCCTANISVNRSRVKQYIDAVYLKDGQSFEIELFNPKTFSVLAKISINGVQISSSGIVLKPGQRVFLERFLDEAKKFRFETYEVEDSTQAKEAIRKNGEVKVEFFHERPQAYASTYVYAGTPTTWVNTFTVQPASFTVNGELYNSLNPGGISFGGTTINNVSMSAAGSLETGRVESGGASNQSFEQYTGSFNWLVDESVTLLIKPVSAKPVEVGEIRNYCTNCSTRLKKSTWKFCPNCGTQVEG